MIKVRINSDKIDKVLKNSVAYSLGFLDGAEMNQIRFNMQLGEFIESALYKYIDAKARMSPDSFHHVYEWDQVGNSSARLFEFNSKASKKIISFTGQFLPSKSISLGSSEPFIDKARIMENKISITIEPKNSSVLSFEDDGETIFTSSSIEISNPGGDAVAGSFSSAVDSFFKNYLTVSVLKGTGVLGNLDKANEYSNDFSRGTQAGRSPGVRAGRKYMSLPSGVVIE